MILLLLVLIKNGADSNYSQLVSTGGYWYYYPILLLEIYYYCVSINHQYNTAMVASQNTVHIKGHTQWCVVFFFI